MICSRCGEKMRLTEKDSVSDSEIREYLCDRCGFSDWEDRGDALENILSNDRGEEERQPPW